MFEWNIEKREAQTKRAFTEEGEYILTKKDNIQMWL